MLSLFLLPLPQSSLSAGILASSFTKKMESIWREHPQLSITTNTHRQTSVTICSIFTSVTTEELLAIQSMGNIQIVFLLSFSCMGLQPNVAGVVDFYMKTFDLEILTTSYFIKKITNKQTNSSSNQRDNGCLMWPTGHQYKLVCTETFQNAQRGLIGGSPFTNGGLSRLSKLFPFPSIWFPLSPQL